MDGIVYDLDGATIPGAKVIETGTTNETESDIAGRFQLRTLKDSCNLTISWIGFKSQTVVITSDTTLNVTLDNDFYNTRWIAFGTSYGIVNQVFGLQISNGVDEEPLIHFEDFQDKILIKVHGQTDFGDNYLYGGEFGLTRLKFIRRTTIKYDFVNFKDSELFLTDINLTSRIRYFRNTGLIFRTGYQKLNDIENFGIGIGLEQGSQNFYIGLNSRYYFDYFHHEAYLQFIIPSKDLLSIRTIYNRIDNMNLMSVGLNYAFVRTEK
ncbi:MAG: carboxypeptidase-like regulatory domain-containing protein [Cyclobacteriaceae bacterium]